MQFGRRLDKFFAGGYNNSSDEAYNAKGEMGVFMTAIYLCELAQNVRNVYQTEDPVFRKADLLADPAAFAETEYVFSTWGMPQLNEAEIRHLLPRLKAVFYAAGSVQAFARPFLASGVKVFSAWAPMPCQSRNTRWRRSFSPTKAFSARCAIPTASAP
ncbi:MAG: hypothetical protein IJC93_03935 [Clostridia bacterium]|nr:hypothetical protein [Clostridia bacterium]